MARRGSSFPTGFSRRTEIANSKWQVRARAGDCVMRLEAVQEEEEEKSSRDKLPDLRLAWS